MIVAFIACLCWSIAIFPVTIAVQKLGHQPVNFFRHLIAFVVLGILVFLLQPHFINHLFNCGSFNLLLIFTSGCLGLVLSDVLRLRALNHLGIKTVSFFSACQPAIGFLFGWLFLNEQQNLIGVAGLVLTITGLILFTQFNYQSTNTRPNLKELLLLVLCLLAQGLSLVFSKMAIIKTYGLLQPYEIAYIRIIGAVVCMLGIALFNKKLVRWTKDLLQNKNKANIYFFTSTFLGNITAVCCSLYALSVLPSVVAQSVFSLAPFFILVINHLYKKEKLKPLQVIAAIISITGVYLVLWQKEWLEKL
jgi:drug/metabolite transporter (DMT)-like permease